jgi:hypothetical protein
MSIWELFWPKRPRGHEGETMSPPKTADLSDDELDAVADAEAVRQGALAEHARRVEAKRLADEETARAAAEAERQTKIAELTKVCQERGRDCEEAHASLDRTIEALGAVLNARDEILRARWYAEAALKSFGAPVPPMNLPPFRPKAVAAARRIVPTLVGELIDPNGPLASAMRDNPAAFR